MKRNLLEMALKIKAPFITPEAINYRPPSWPPPQDWPAVIDKNGIVISRWGDPIWDLSPWHRSPMQLKFLDAEASPDSIGTDNAELLRQSIGWFIWGPRGYRTASTTHGIFCLLKTVISLCDRNGIRASTLQRFPKVIEEIPSCLAASQWERMISTFHRLYDVRDSLGFNILDESGIKRLAEAALDHEHVQTPYIPPRIWLYQLNRIRECLEDFMAHREQIESCFLFCIDAYAKNYKTLSAALGKKNKGRGPFTEGNDPLRKRHYIGPFAETARSFGVEDLLRRWVVGWEETRVSMLSSYFSLVTFAGLLYIANFTLQRRKEVNSLRADCLIWENDENFGRIPLVRGETTKTETDSDARWVADACIEIAIDALSLISRLRMECDKCNPKIQPSPADIANPYLSSSPTEPWGFGIGRAKPYYIRSALTCIKTTVKRYKLLFDEEQLRITSEDLKIARQLTPNLPEDEFAVGLVWPLAWHQYRRTTAVNMAASGIVSNRSMQQQLKHASRLMPLYYARGHTNLMLNEEVERTIVHAMYEALAMSLQEVVSDRFVSPHSPERKQDLVAQPLSAKDVGELKGWAKARKVWFRETRLGGCMKQGPCEYGGLESVTHCAGGDGKSPCMEALFDREREEQVRAHAQHTTVQMEHIPSDHPRHAALAKELRAMENYLNVISKQR